MLRQVKERADIVLDTTLLSASQLRSNIHELFRSDDPEKDDFVVNCISFGFKFGVPADADLMSDVCQTRFMMSSCVQRPVLTVQFRTTCWIPRRHRAF